MVAAIPQEIVDIIIEAVGRDDSSVLKKCAVVSSSFLLPCRKHLFSELVLRDVQACQRLYQFLVGNQVVQSFVRSISIELNISPDSEFIHHDKPLIPILQLPTSLIAVLRLPFRRLESFSVDSDTNNIWFESYLYWDDFSGELKDTLSTVIRSSTLKTLYLNDVSVPIMLFLGINLTKLVLTDLAPNNFGGVQLTPAGSEEVATTVVDHCVWNYFKALPGTRFSTPAYFLLI